MSSNKVAVEATSGSTRFVFCAISSEISAQPRLCRQQFSTQAAPDSFPKYLLIATVRMTFRVRSSPRYTVARATLSKTSGIPYKAELDTRKISLERAVSAFNMSLSSRNSACPLETNCRALIAIAGNGGIPIGASGVAVVPDFSETDTEGTSLRPEGLTKHVSLEIRQCMLPHRGKLWERQTRNPIVLSAYHFGTPRDRRASPAHGSLPVLDIYCSATYLPN